MNKAVIFAAAVAVATPAMADVVPVSNLSSGVLPATNDGTTFTASSTELRQNSDSSWSSAAITSDTALSSDGSIELTGNRTRLYNDLSGLSLSLDSIQSLTADYLVLNGGSAGGIQSPAFRVYVNDRGVISELIWEASYNGGNNLGSADSVAATDLFWRYTPGCGYVGTGGCASGSYVMNTLTGWAGSPLFSDTAMIIGIGVGQGGGAGDGFHAYADNLTLNTLSGSTTYNFQSAPAVPEPRTWATMLLGFGAIGGAMRRRRKGALTQPA
jgi:hypothetical protein